jgi:hypothetical protein
MAISSQSDCFTIENRLQSDSKAKQSDSKAKQSDSKAIA